MPSIREKTTKTGNKFYEIRVSRGRGKSYLTTRWHPLKGGASAPLTGNLPNKQQNLSGRCKPVKW